MLLAPHDKWSSYVIDLHSFYFPHWALLFKNKADPSKRLVSIRGLDIMATQT